MGRGARGRARSRRAGALAALLFALERLDLLDAERIVYRLPKPQRDGTTVTLTPLELIDHVAALIPPPRRHRHRYHGVLAPNSPLRAAATAYGHDPVDAPGACDEVASPSAASARSARSPARYLWAMLLARLFESQPLVCPNCGADMRIIAFITDAAPIDIRFGGTEAGQDPRTDEAVGHRQGHVAVGGSQGVEDLVLAAVGKDVVLGHAAASVFSALCHRVARPC